jgi:hypothetical protein
MIPEGRGLHLAVATKLPPPALILQLSEIWTFESSALSYVGLGQSLSIIVDKPCVPSSHRAMTTRGAVSGPRGFGAI